MTTQTITKSEFRHLNRAWSQWEKACKSGKDRDFFRFEKLKDRLSNICLIALEERMRGGFGWEVV